MENYKTLMKKIEKVKKIDISCSWIRRFNVVMMSFLPKLIHAFNTIPNQNPVSYLVDTGKLILNLYGKMKNLE